MLHKLNNYSNQKLYCYSIDTKKVRYSASYFFWWAVMDSNHRRRQPAELQSAPFVHSGNCPQNTFEPLVGFKPTTYSLQVSCSITELKRQISFSVFQSSISYIDETAAKIDIFFNKQKKVSKKIISSTLLISFCPINYT